MDRYVEIDPAIDAWAAKYGLDVIGEWAGEDSRFAYTSGNPPRECFQVAIDPPAEGRVAVHARSVETWDDQELEERWDGPSDMIGAMLEAAMAAVARWRESYDRRWR